MDEKWSTDWRGFQSVTETNTINNHAFILHLRLVNQKKKNHAFRLFVENMQTPGKKALVRIFSSETASDFKNIP